MSKIVTFIYGLLIILVPICAWFGFLTDYLPFILGFLGIIVFFTPIISKRKQMPKGMPMVGLDKQRTGIVNFIRRWIFGLYLFVVGIVSATGLFEEWTANISLYSVPGQIILLIIGIIYFLATFAKTRKIQIKVGGSY